MNDNEPNVRDAGEKAPMQEHGPEDKPHTDVVKLVSALLSQGIEKDKLAAGLQAAAKDGSICEKDLKAAMDAIQQVGNAEADEEKTKAEDAFGMKFLG